MMVAVQKKHPPRGVVQTYNKEVKKKSMSIGAVAEDRLIGEQYIFLGKALEPRQFSSYISWSKLMRFGRKR